MNRIAIRRALVPPIRFLVRPIWRPIWRRIEARIDGGGPADQLLRRHPAAFLDAVATMAALAHEVRELEGRVEALEAELRARPREPGHAETTLSPPP